VGYKPGGYTPPVLNRPTAISVAMHHSARLSFCEILGRPAEGPCVRREASESILEASARVLACFSRTLHLTVKTKVMVHAAPPAPRALGVCLSALARSRSC
jgi:hypothetical protein